MEKTKEQLINDFKKANKQRRAKMATAAGFTTPEYYLSYLQSGGEKNKVPKKTVKSSKMKGIFYIVDILDATGSMEGGKYENSKEGIIAGIKDLAPRKDVKYSLIEFIQLSRDLNRAVTNSIPSEIHISNVRNKFSGAIGGNTPLYKTVYDVINEFKALVTKDDKVLMNVYTDGGNNTAYEYQKMAATLINQVQKENFTITFVATSFDLEKIKRDINIDDSNTLATANTAEGFKMSMTQTMRSRGTYFASAEAGESVLKGFYKKGGKLN